jgi:hypothetical protein
VKSRYKNLAAALCVTLLPFSVFAGEVPLPTLTGSYTNNSTSYLLALNDNDAPAKQGASSTDKPTEFNPRSFTMSKAHQYFGLGTLVLMGLTVITNPGEGCEHNCVSPQPPRKTSGTAHTRFARAAATLLLKGRDMPVLMCWRG